MARAWLIAEIGTSHQGDRGKLRELIHAAADSGADCAKFQWVLADEIIHPLTGEVRLPTGNIRLHQRFRELETDAAFFALAKETCEERGLAFLCTPFGLESARGLRSLGSSAYKIASPELNHHPLVRELASYHQPLIVSSGVSTLGDIDETLELIRGVWGLTPPAVNGSLAPLTLLHCITAYPAPEEDFNLLLIRTLAAILGVPLGLSDHSMDPVLVPLISVILGGVMVEKHFTLSRATDGLDDPIALDPPDFARMVAAIRKAERESWPSHAATLADPMALAAYLGRCLNEVGAPASVERILTILGSGVKRLAPSEAANYGRTNRSIHAIEAMKAGHVLQASDLAVLRTEKILRPGLHPRYLDRLPGRVLSRDVPAGEGIVWEDLS